MQKIGFIVKFLQRTEIGQMNGTLRVLAGFLCFLMVSWVALPAANNSIEIHKFSEAPDIDGIIDNLVWMTDALRIDNFLQLTPGEKGSATLRLTELSQIGVSYQNSMERYAGVDFNKNSLSADGSVDFIEWLPFSLDYS